jgi:hypothetical protein
VASPDACTHIPTAVSHRSRTAIAALEDSKPSSAGVPSLQAGRRLDYGKIHQPSHHPSTNSTPNRMITCTINETAANGFNINTTVNLEWVDDKPFAERPFFVQTRVNFCPMAHSFHKTNNKAKRAAERMQAAYMRVHARKIVNHKS